jgi:hypothetical protein
MGATAITVLVSSEAYDGRPCLGLHWLMDMCGGLHANPPSLCREAV